MKDIHGNLLRLNDPVYIVNSINKGSNSKRLLYGRVFKIKKNIASVVVFENEEIYRVKSNTILRPLE